MELFRAFGRLALEGREAVERGLERVNQLGRQVGDRMRALGGRMTSVGRTLSTRVSTGIAAATGAFTYFALSAADSAREIQRTAEISGASVETVQEWSAAFRTVGIEQDKLTDIFRDVLDRIGDYATTGGGPLVDFMENIASRTGLTIEQLQRMSAPEAILAIDGALRQVGVSASEYTFYMEAIASDLSDANPLLANNAQLLREQADAARDAGGILSSEQVSALNDLTQEMNLFKTAIEGVKNQIGAAFAPVLSSVLQIIREDFIPVLQNLSGYVEAAGEWFGGLRRETQKWIIIGGGVAAILGPIIVALGIFVMTAGALASALITAAPYLLALAVGLAIGYAAGLLLVWLFEKLVEGIEWLGEKWGEFVDWLGQKWDESLAAVTEWASGIGEKIGEAIDGIVEWFRNLPERVMGFVRSMVSGVLGWIGDMADGIVSRLNRLYDIVVGNSIIPDLARDVVSSVAGMADGSINETERMARGMDRAMPRDGLDPNSSPVRAASGGAGSFGSTTIDMRNSIIRDDRDMLERMRQRGLVPQGVF
jgi:hypothetical protein